MRRVTLLGAAAVGAIALAYAIPMQSTGCAQTAHYAAIRAYAAGHPYIDRYAGESCDIVHENGHYYAAKAPAMDFWTVPWYLLLHAAGAIPGNRNAGQGYPNEMLGVSQRGLWQLSLWAVVLPALGLLLLARRTVERLEPGLGVAGAAILGLATLVMPFSTVLFPQVPAAALMFLSFSLLYGRVAGLLRVGAAGAAAGLAVSTDLPFAVPAVVLGLYAAWPSLRRLVAFGAGGLVGLLPLLLFDVWAFGNPLHTPYKGAALNPGAGGRELSPGPHGFFSVHLPSPRVAVELVLSQRGLLVLMPVLAAAVAGVVLLRQRGLRREAWLVGGLFVVELVLNSGRSGLVNALGGFTPGPRYLVVLLPFLVFALVPALRRRPVTVAALALVSAVAMAVATSAEPLLANDDTRHWLSRIGHGNFTSTVVSLSGVGHGWLAILPFYVLVAAATAAAVAATRLPARRAELAAAAAALAAWGLVEHGAPELLRVDREVHQWYGLVAAVLLLAAAAWAAFRLSPLGLPLVAFATVRFADHTKWALLLAACVLAALAFSERARRRPVPA